MRGSYFIRRIRSPGHWQALLVALVLVLGGCGTKEPPLSPGEASFKKEVKEMIERLSPLLMEPVSQKSTAEINVTLQEFFSDPQNEPRSCPLKIVVTDKSGTTLGKYPVEKGYGVDFSSYSLVQKVLREGKTAQGRLFLQDGSRIYIICAPLLQKGEVVGIMALGVDAKEANRTCGLGEHKFLAIDFNR